MEETALAPADAAPTPTAVSTDAAAPTSGSAPPPVLRLRTGLAGSPNRSLMAEQKTNHVREIRLRRLRALTKANATLRDRVTRAADFEAARHRACLASLGQNVDSLDAGNIVVDAATACRGAYDDTNPVDEDAIAARITPVNASSELALLEQELGLEERDD